MTTLREDLLGVLQRQPRCQTYYLKNVLRSAPYDGLTHEPRRDLKTRDVLNELRRMERDGLVRCVYKFNPTVWSRATL